MSAISTSLITAEVQDGQLVTDYLAEKEEEESESQYDMGYDQFLTLLCAEMQYQDPLEPTSNTEYVAQLATFSQLEATLDMADAQENQMVYDLVGKYVIVAETDSTTGSTSYIDGKVDYVVTQDDGSLGLCINGSVYSVDDIDTVADTDYYEAVALANTLSNMISQLPDVENITTSYQTAIEQIQSIYDSMTDYQKNYVSSDTLSSLTEYTTRLSALTATEDTTESVTEDAADTTDTV